MIKLSALIVFIFFLLVPSSISAQGSGTATGSSHSCSHESTSSDSASGLPPPFSQPPLPPEAPPVACTPFSPPVCRTDPTAAWCPTSYVCDNGCTYICATPPAPPPGETTYSISGNVCDDVNGDGIRNPGEDGHAIVTLNRTGTGTTSTTTNAFGNYGFTGLASGTYNVSIVIPPGFNISPPSAPTTRTATVPPDNVSTNFCIALPTSSNPQPFTANGSAAACSGVDSYINLSWTQSVNAERYHIYRDGFFIATNVGQANTFYPDLVPNGTSHTYFIAAERIGAPLTRATWGNPPGDSNNDGWSNSITSASCGGASFTANCFVNSPTAYINQNVTWTATATGGTGVPPSPYSWAWSGTDGLSGITNPISRSYSTAGIKTASVQVTSSGGQTITAACTASFSSVNVSGQAPWIQTRGGDVHSDTGINTPGGPSSAATPPPTFRRVFVTSTLYNGNLGGLTGADAQCQTRANAVGLGGTWRAWLSDSSQSPASRFIQSTLPYRLLNGTTIANNWTDLTDETLAATITRTETGGTPAQSCIMTNTNQNGSIFTTTETCANWTSALSTDTRRAGDSNSTTTWSNGCATATCDLLRPLYCFEQ